MLHTEGMELNKKSNPHHCLSYSEEEVIDTRSNIISRLWDSSTVVSHHSSLAKYE
jgi:hypothetical protein